jgi:hypothetical protein
MYEIEYWENGGWQALELFEGDIFLDEDEAEEALRKDLITNGPGFASDELRNIANYRIVLDGYTVRTFTGQAWMDGGR